jgi:hypothetical protein
MISILETLVRAAVYPCRLTYSRKWDGKKGLLNRHLSHLSQLSQLI